MSEHKRHTFIADSACECGLMVSELVTRQQRQIRELERVQAEDRAAIRAAFAAIRDFATPKGAIWVHEHAAAIARATGQEGAR